MGFGGGAGGGVRAFATFCWLRVHDNNPVHIHHSCRILPSPCLNIAFRVRNISLPATAPCRNGVTNGRRRSFTCMRRSDSHFGKKK